jgi:Rho termination factor, N-terminal domain
MNLERQTSMRSFLLGLLLGTLGPILFDRLRHRANSEGAGDTPPAAAATGSRPEQPSHGEGATPNDLSQLTAAELYRHAKAAGISGRSGMSKSELIAALRSVNGQ